MQATNSPSEKKTSRRVYYIDALRVLATLAILIFHSSRVFDLGEDWNVYNEQTSRIANLFQSFFHPWHMQLFILLAGAGTWFALRKRSGRQYTAERFLRIFLPLLFGMFLIQAPLQLYIYRLQRHQFDGNFLQFPKLLYNRSGHWLQGESFPRTFVVFALLVHRRYGRAALAEISAG